MLGSWYYVVVQYFYKRRRAKRLAEAAARRHAANMKYTCVNTQQNTLRLTSPHKDDVVCTMLVGYYENNYGHRKASVISCNYPDYCEHVKEKHLADSRAWAAKGKQKYD